MPDEHDFLRNPEDGYALYQLKPGKETENLRFAAMAELEADVSHANYRMVYAGPLPENSWAQSDMGLLEGLYERFNLERPADFYGHSMSVSDVVLLRREGQIAAYYCDSFGFCKLPDFLSDTQLRNTEMQLEQNGDMIDGIINNLPPEKPSLRDELKTVKAQVPKQKEPQPGRNEPER